MATNNFSLAWQSLFSFGRLNAQGIFFCLRIQFLDNGYKKKKNTLQQTMN